MFVVLPLFPVATQLKLDSVYPVAHCPQIDGESCEIQPAMGVKQKPELRILGGAQDVHRPSSWVGSRQEGLECWISSRTIAIKKMEFLIIIFYYN